MKQLENSIFQLKNNPSWAVKVEAKSPNGTFQPVEKNNIQSAAILATYGSVENFFEELNKKGMTQLRITDRKMNGSVFKTISTYEVEFQNGSPTAVNLEPIVSQNQQPQVAFGMSGSFGPGLGMVEVHRIHDYDRILRENIKLEAKVEYLTAENKAKIEALTAENKVLETTNLTNELLGIKKVENTEAQAKLMASASAYIPLMQAFLMGSRGQQAAAPGLGNPVSPVKEIFVKMDDNFLSDLLPIIQGMQNVEFDNELNQLLVKYNLITQ